MPGNGKLCLCEDNCLISIKERTFLNYLEIMRKFCAFWWLAQLCLMPVLCSERDSEYSSIIKRIHMAWQTARSVFWGIFLQKYETTSQICFVIFLLRNALFAYDSRSLTITSHVFISTSRIEFQYWKVARLTSIGCKDSSPKLFYSMFALHWNSMESEFFPHWTHFTYIIQKKNR